MQKSAFEVIISPGIAAGTTEISFAPTVFVVKVNNDDCFSFLFGGPSAIFLNYTCAILISSFSCHSDVIIYLLNKQILSETVLCRMSENFRCPRQAIAGWSTMHSQNGNSSKGGGE